MSKQRLQKSSIGTPEVKETAGGKIHPVFRRVTEEELSSALVILTSVVGGRQPILTQQQICRLTNRGTTTVSNWVKEGALPTAAFILIAQEAARLGDFSLLKLIVPANYAIAPVPAGTVNGDCADEECAIVGAADRARLAFDSGDVAAFEQSLDELRQQIASLEAEGRALR